MQRNRLQVRQRLCERVQRDEKRQEEAAYPLRTDNGGEFFDAEGVEKALGGRLCYCESYSSWQKGAAECNRKHCRRAVLKKTSMDGFDERGRVLMMSHASSTSRGVWAAQVPWRRSRPSSAKAPSTHSSSRRTCWFSVCFHPCSGSYQTVFNQPCATYGKWLCRGDGGSEGSADG